MSLPFSSKPHSPRSNSGWTSGSDVDGWVRMSSSARSNTLPFEFLCSPEEDQLISRSISRLTLLACCCRFSSTLSYCYLKLTSFVNTGLLGDFRHRRINWTPSVKLATNVMNSVHKVNMTVLGLNIVFQTTATLLTFLLYLIVYTTLSISSG